MDLLAFWGRRARRLFPALLLLMPAIALYGLFVAAPEELPSLRADALAALGYVANWRTIFSHKSYWDLFVAPSPLEHTWSLAIEEQFYLVWPLVVIVVRRPKALLAICLTLGAASVATMLLRYDPANPSRVYLGTDTRAAGILAGAALASALALRPDSHGDSPFAAGPPWLLDALGGVAALGLGIAWWRLEGQAPFLYRGGLWLTELGALVLILCALQGPSSRVARMLAVRPLTLVGTLSYGLYLWHWPVNVVVTAERLAVLVGGPFTTDGWAASVALHGFRFALTFALATASYLLVERPIRVRGVPFGRPWVVGPAAVAMVVLLVVGATDARASARKGARGPRAASTLSEAPATADPATLTIPPPEAPEAVTFRVLFLGDSTANSLGWALRGLREPGVAAELLGQDGCTMLADLCGGPTWVDQAREARPEAVVVFLGGAFMHGITAHGRWQKACQPDWDRTFQAKIAQRLGSLATWSAATGARLVALTLPQPLGPWESRAFRDETRCINRDLQRAAAQVPGVELVDLAEHLCPGGACQRVLGGTVVRPDGVHYSMEGGGQVARWLLGELRRPQ